MNTVPSFSQKTFRTLVRFDDPVVRDHRVHGVRIMPGVTFLDLFCRTAQSCGFQLETVELRNVLFPEPLTVAEGMEREVKIEIVSSESHWLIEAASRNREVDSGKTLSDWQLHAKAELHVVDTEPSPTLNLSTPSASAHRDLDELYAALRLAQIQHRPFMKPEGRVELRSDCVVAQVDLTPEAADYADHFLLHPAFLDNATGISFFANYSQARYRGTPFIPLFIERFRAFGPLGKHCYIRVPLRTELEKEGGDIGRDEEILIYNHAGSPAARFQNLTFKKVRSAESIQSLLNAQDRSEDALAEIKGSPLISTSSPHRSLPLHDVIRAELRDMVAEAKQISADEVDVATGFYDLGLDSSDLLKIANRLQTRAGQYLYPTLLFEYPNIEALADYLAEHHIAAFEKPAADSIPKSSNQDPKRPRELTRLHFGWRKLPQNRDASISAAARTLLIVTHGPLRFEPVQNGSSNDVQRVFHVTAGLRFRRTSPSAFEVRPFEKLDMAEVLRQLHAEESDPDLILFSSDFASDPKDGVKAVLALTQALLERRSTKRVRVISIAERAYGGLPWAAAQAGFAATLRRETPHIAAAAVYTDDQLQSDALSQLTALPFGDDLLFRFRQGAISAWRAFPLSDEAPPIESSSLRRAGTFVIAGGAGGIGLLFAEHLARRHQARLALIGRSELSAENAARLENLRSQGSEVLYLRADVASKPELERALNEAREELGPLHGIIHAAGQLRDGLVTGLSAADAEATLDPKVRGAILLDELTATDPLDFFCLFSSLSSFAGNRGQAAYTAANGFLNGLAEEREVRRKRGEVHGRTLSILWPLWAAGGMRIDDETAAALFHESGMAPLQANRGLQAFEEFLSTPATHVTVIEGDRAKLNAFLKVDTEADQVSSPLEEAQSTTPLYREQDIAIIGVSGRYPLARNLDEFWENLSAGRDCISEIPADRWDHARYFDPRRGTPGKCYSRWGGFISDADRFDPVFFNISPRDAELMDPQERLFLETVWRSLEDAGYCKSSLAAEPVQHRVGVFAGVMWGGYQLFGAEELMKGNVVTANSPYWSIANRVSYFFNLNGPSMAVDSACSSSLLAVHLACESLRRGECRMAIAGGVNLSLHPAKYLLLSQMGMLSTHGRCKTFSAEGDGYVPGEGVGAVVLKPAQAAVRDGDTIYAIIRGSAVNHDGGGNGFTVPNPLAQAAVIEAALTDADVSPRTISYLEAHGTGTSLGDPVEIAGLTRAWSKSTADRQFCAIGSVKSAIGHLEAAAGISAVTKVLLQFRHRLICPTQHAGELNPKIDFKNSPFVVQREAMEWKRPVLEHDGCKTELPLRAGISSFGAGGANVHLILEEPAPAVISNSPRRVVPLFLLSAQSSERLAALARIYISFLEGTSLLFEDILFTLQTGREPLAERLAIRARSTLEARQALSVYLAGGSAPGIFRGKASRKVSGADALTEAIADWHHANGGESGAITTLAQLWTGGNRIDWKGLSSGHLRRVSLPGYSFAGKRYWLPQRNVQVISSPHPAESSEPAASASPAQFSEQVTLFKPVWKQSFLSNGAPLPNEILVVGATPDHEHFLRAAGSKLTFRKLEEMEGSLSDSTADRRAILFFLPGDSSALKSLQSLYLLCRGLLKSLAREKIRILVLGEQREGGNACLDAAAAFLKSLSLEQPRLSGSCLRISGTIHAQTAKQILAEFTQKDAEVFLRSGARLVRSWEPMVSPQQHVASVSLRHRGVYVLTGGTGAIGLHIARFLAEKYSARLVLLGRSTLPADFQTAPGMPEPLHEKLQRIRDLKSAGAEVIYLRADTSSPDELGAAIAQARSRFGEINGVIHCAGVTQDGFLAKKSWDNVADVLGPKVTGTELLDELTRADALDFFALFGSSSSITGNLGQCDYSAANGFLNGFAVQRENARVRGRCQGRTVCISWPLWAEGGMQAGDLVAKTLERRGIRPLATQDALLAFEQALQGHEPQLLVWSGRATALTSSASHGETTAISTAENASLVDDLEEYLKSILSRVTRLPVSEIDHDAGFPEYGVDSIALNEILQTINRDHGDILDPFGALEHNSIRALARYLHARGANQTAPRKPTAKTEPATENSVHAGLAAGSHNLSEPVAVIGMAARFPGADDLDSFWNNLQQGLCSIREIPRERWDAEALFTNSDSLGDGKTYSKWGGFLNGIDQFDPEFFRMTEAEARLTDPLHRLMLETAARAFENAGYDGDRLQKAAGGIFIGAKQGEYADLVGTKALLKAGPATAWKFNSACMITTRIAECFNLQGPACLVDTACSSSLVAVHLACESLRRGECEFAIAGGVELLLTPKTFVHFSHSHSLAPDGQCRPFESEAGGTVLGEGCGAVILKPLSRAIADGDFIHAIVEGSATNNSGSARTAVDQVAAMKQVMRKALHAAQVQISDLSLLELHGEGSLLRDAVELRSIKEIWEESGSSPGQCLLGSVKANIGHLLLASGIAGFIKACLGLRHRGVPRHPRPAKLANYAGLAGTPFRLASEPESWTDNTKRRHVGVNASGIAGINCFVVCAESPVTNPPRSLPAKPMHKRRFWIDAPSSAEGLSFKTKPPTSGREQMRELLTQLRAGEVTLADARRAISNTVPPITTPEARGRVLLEQLQSGTLSLETAKAELEKIRAATRSPAAPFAPRSK